MKKIIFIFCLLLSLSSCTYRRKGTIDISYAIHYPDTTVMYNERYNVTYTFWNDNDYKNLTSEDLKPQIYSYDGTNMIDVPHSRSIGPRTTAPIHIISSTVYLDN